MPDIIEHTCSRLRRATAADGLAMQSEVLRAFAQLFQCLPDVGGDLWRQSSATEHEAWTESLGELVGALGYLVELQCDDDELGDHVEALQDDLAARSIHRLGLERRRAELVERHGLEDARIGELERHIDALHELELLTEKQQQLVREWQRGGEQRVAASLRLARHAAEKRERLRELTAQIEAARTELDDLLREGLRDADARDRDLLASVVR